MAGTYRDKSPSTTPFAFFQRNGRAKRGQSGSYSPFTSENSPHGGILVKYDDFRNVKQIKGKMRLFARVESTYTYGTNTTYGRDIPRNTTYPLIRLF